YNGLVRYDLAGGGLAGRPSYLYIPLQASRFLLNGEDAVFALKDRPDIMIGRFSDTVSYVTETVPTLGTPLQLAQYADTIVALSRDARLIERFALSDRVVTRAVMDAVPERHFRGDVITQRGERRILLADQFGGLDAFRIDGPRPDGNAEHPFAYPGPITGLTTLGDFLVTAGLRNPLELYRLPTDSVAELDTTLYDGLSDIRWVKAVGDRLYAYFTPLQSVVEFEKLGDSIIVSNSVSIDSTQAGEFRLTTAGGRLGVITWNGPQAFIYSFPDSVQGSIQTTINVAGGISDISSVDSLIIISSNKRSLWIYRVYDNYDIEFRAQISTSGTVHHMIPNSGTSPSVMYFSDSELGSLDLSNPFSPFKLFSLPSPLDIRATVRYVHGLFDRYLLTIGRDGIALFKWFGARSMPKFESKGGPSGNMITRVGDKLAVSDGTAIHIYLLTGIGGSSPADTTPTAELPFALRNYPNPFNPVTTIAYRLLAPRQVRLDVYNLLGQHVRTLVNGSQPAGEHLVQWDGRSDEGITVASGLYFYRLSTREQVVTRKMVLLR
ncbi:MAG: T9SS C-terminal target domain-containing protein, partial [Candidatus Zixiibacteriota bacterium]